MLLSCVPWLSRGMEAGKTTQPEASQHGDFFPNPSPVWGRDAQMFWGFHVQVLGVRTYLCRRGSSRSAGARG